MDNRGSNRLVIGAITAGLFGTGVPPVTNSYESIATVNVGSGGTSTISFTSIPSTFKHLQIRGIGRTGGSSTDSAMNFNSDSTSGNYYANHQIFGDGSSASAATSPASTRLDPFYVAGSGVTSNVFAGIVIDILDYQNTNKNKTLRTLQGWDANGSGFVIFRSGLWMQTAAINRIDWTVSGNWAQYSSFALYGIKG